MSNRYRAGPWPMRGVGMRAVAYHTRILADMMRRARWIGALLSVAALVAVAPRAAHAQPAWRSVWTWVGGCAESEPAGDTTPGTVDLVGATGLPAAYIA